ncbi:MAG TPA: NADH dehydrogenase [Thermoprotei archaeon]|nr:NADH dehydrogenase [Thermoprotei archaeon]
MSAVGLYFLIVPFVVALLAPLFQRALAPRWLAALTALSLAAPASFAAYVIMSGSKYAYEFVSAPALGSFMVIVDGLNWPIIVGVAVVSSAIAFYSVPYMSKRFEEEKRGDWGAYFMLYGLFAASMIGMAEANNFIMFYLFLELALIPSFVLIALYGYGDRGRISSLYFIWTHVGALTFLTGAFIYGIELRTFNFYPVPANASLLASYAVVIVMLLMVGLFIKMAVFGVHAWLPYAHAEAPTPISALLSPNLIGIAGYAIVRIVYGVFPSYLIEAQWVIVAFALATIFYGGLLVFRQWDLKRLLAYSSIAQMGYVLLGIASLNPLGIAGAILQFYSHAIGKSLLFSSAGVMITENDGLRDVNKMGGLAKKMPYTASLSLWGFMNISGLPPSIGFFSKLFILMGVASAFMPRGSWGLLVFALSLVSLGITPAYSFVTMKKVFFGPLGNQSAKEGTLMLLIPMVVIAIFGLLFFVFPSVLLTPLYAYLR